MEMNNRLFCLTFALVTSKSASQILTVTPSCIIANETVTLKCETTDFTSSVFFYLEVVNDKGGCFFGSCSTSITGYEEPAQSGTSTQMTITAYNDSRDGGVWACSFGATRSNNYTVELGNCPTVTTEMPFKSSSLDQTSSSQNPSTDTSKTQKTDTNRMSTTDNVLTSMSQHFTSDHEVTTQILNRSNNAMDFSVGAVIAIVISGIISVCLVVFLICLYLRRKHTRKQTSETPEPKLRRTNEKQNKEQYSRKNVRGQTIEPSTYPTDYYDSGNPRTKNLNKMSNHRQKHTNENKLSQSMQNNIEDKIRINYPSSRNHQTRANNRGPSIPLAHFAPNNSNNYRCVPTMLYVDPHEPHAYMCQDYSVYPANTRVQDRQSGKRYYS